MCYYVILKCCGDAPAYKACSPDVIKHVCLAETGRNATLFYYFFNDNENVMKDTLFDD